MAFSAKILGSGQVLGSGGKRIAWGSWTSGSTTGGDIETGLAVVEIINLSAKGSSVTTNGVVINEVLPLASKITIVTDSGVDGYWTAIGV